MSKITFRADDDLVDELEAFDASKSEVMREALRTYLESRRCESSAPGRQGESPRDRQSAPRESPPEAGAATIDGAVRDVVRRVLDEELERRTRPDPQDVNVTVALDGTEGNPTDGPSPTEDRRTPDPARGAEGEDSCSQCGEALDSMHVFCPNCGEKASQRIFCECGEEVRSDWSFCPGCGRRTPAADVLDSR